MNLPCEYPTWATPEKLPLWPQNFVFNSYPAKLFLGDSGAQTLGFLLAAVAIVYDPNTGIQSSTWFLPIMIFYVPLFDLALVVFSRLRRGRPIHHASRDHTYHRLSKRGISINHSVLVLHGISLVMSMIGYLCLNLPVLYANIVFCLTMILGIAIFFELDNHYSWPSWPIFTSNSKNL